MVRRFGLIGLMAAALVAGAAPAVARPYKYQFSGDVNGSFEVEGNPAPPALVFPTQFGVQYLSGRGNVGIAGIAVFGTVPDHGLTILKRSGPIYLDGATLFTGSLSAPTLKTGTFTLINAQTNNAVLLQVGRTGPGAPGPGLGVGLAAGVAAAAALVLTRRRKSARA